MADDDGEHAQNGVEELAARYNIEPKPATDEDFIRHGWIEINNVRVQKSFLCFENMNDARDVHENLSNLKGDSFLKSYFIVHREIENLRRYWLAVDKVDHSLERYCKINAEHRWIGPNQKINRRSPLDPAYQDIIRDIITGMCELHSQQYTHGGLSIRDILIVNNRAKLAFIRNKPCWALEGDPDDPDCTHRKNAKRDFSLLKTVFETALYAPRFHPEFYHFHDSATVNNWHALAKLYFHPLLMAPVERFYLCLKMVTLIKYPGHEIAKKKAKQIPIKWLRRVKGREHYRQILRYQRENFTSYGETVWDMFRFVRNSIAHINENMRITEKEIEEDLSTMLPESFNHMYEQFNEKELASGSGQLVEELLLVYR